MTKTYETKLQVAITSEGHHKFWKGIAYEDAQGTWTRSESWQVRTARKPNIS